MDWGSDFNQIDKKNIPPVQVPIKKGAIPLCLLFVEFICVFFLWNINIFISVTKFQCMQLWVKLIFRFVSLSKVNVFLGESQSMYCFNHFRL